MSWVRPLERFNLARVVLLVVLSTGTLLVFDAVPVHAKKLRLHDPILINGDSDFSHRNGVSKGKGTSSHPYIIENLEINASLVSCLQCRAAGIEIRNTNSYFIIQDVFIHSGALASYGNSGINLYNVSNGLVETSRFQDNAVGILAHDARNVSIDQNVFLGHDWGIALSHSDQITISRNEISSSSVDGIQIGEVKGGKVDIMGNMVSDSGLSGIMTFATLANVSGNIVRNSGWFGIYDLSDNSYISENSVYSSGRVGIQIQSGAVSVSLNLIANNSLGVLVWLSGIATITGNQVSGSDIGIQSALLAGTTGEAFVYHNNFIQNGINAWPGSNVVWDAGYPAGGNYWSDYTGTDQCSGPGQDICPNPDGLGDTPYYSLGILLDHYPLMKPFA